MRAMSNRLIEQLIILRDSYYCDLYDIQHVRELSYREGFIEVYHLVTESPNDYYRIVSNGSSIDL